MGTVKPRFAVVLCLCLFVPIMAAAASAGSRSVTITLLPANVVQGSLEHLNAKLTSRSGICTLRVRYADGAGQALARKHVIRHRVAWTWQVPAAAGVGKATAHVLCGRTTKVRGYFTVTRRLTPATVTVVKSGLTQIPDTHDNGTTVSYGLVLVNHSSDEDALDVEVDVNLLNSSGNAIGSEAVYLAGIPAGATFYLGRETDTRDQTPVAGVGAIVKVRKSQPRSLLAPSVTNVRLSARQYDGTAIVDGDVTNEATTDLSSSAYIMCVFFDSAGNVVGGSYTFPPFGLPPGAQAAFEIGSSVPGSSVASTEISVEPDYGTT